MEKIRVMVMEEHVEDLLRALQNLESVHLVNMSERLMKWENLVQGMESPLQDLNRWERTRTRLAAILDDLGLDPEPGFLDQYIKPLDRKPVLITHRDEDELLGTADEVMGDIRRQISSVVDRYVPVREALAEMSHHDFDVGLIKPSDKVTIFLGTVASESIRIIQRDLTERLPYTRLYSEGKGRTRYLVVASLKIHEDDVSDILERRGFQRIPVPEELEGSTSSVIKWIDARVAEVRDKNREPIYKLSDAVSGVLGRLEAMEKLGRTGNIIVIEGWVPQARAQETVNTVLEATKGMARVVVTPPDEPEENTPTLLGGPFSSFASLVETYDVPRYNEVDPSSFMAFFFTVFVGLMIGDIALGALVAAAGYVFLRGAGSRSRGMKDLSKVIIASGFSAVLFGVLTGSFMSGVVEEFTDGAIKFPVLWLSPADDPLGFLPVVLMIGVFHLGVGILLGLVNNLMNARYRSILGDQVSATLLLAGAGVLMVKGQFALAGWGLVGYGAVAAGVAALLLGHGPSGLLELTKILSNIISYIRLLALNMASAWMGRTFVLLSAMLLPIAYVGLPLTIFLLAFSQFFLVFISSFSTFAHALRLHYVEFFGRFFMGGGTRFKSLRVERRYTYVSKGEL
ncbi:MAG: V-type ATPase 116kDa subunit family protein [Candidatus Bathyarchaeota archaeon]